MTDVAARPANDAAMSRAHWMNDRAAARTECVADERRAQRIERLVIQASSTRRADAQLAGMRIGEELDVADAQPQFVERGTAARQQRVAMAARKFHAYGEEHDRRFRA